MNDVIGTIAEGLEQSFLMACQVWWALVLGFAISAIVQAWVPRASSSCSYAAIAIAKSLFQRAPRRPRRWPSSSPRPTWSGSAGTKLSETRTNSNRLTKPKTGLVN